MPALKKTSFTGTITWLGVVPDRDADLRSSPSTEVKVLFRGFEGEDHGGETRMSCSRVTSQYKKGTVIRNTRQVSMVSAEELEDIAARMQVPVFDPVWIGAGMVISGIPDFSHIPPSSRLQCESGATFTVDMENRACSLPIPIIEQDIKGAGSAFLSAAKGRRGVTAWVEREGVVRLGDSVRLHIPDQRAWVPDVDVSNSLAK